MSEEIIKNVFLGAFAGFTSALVGYFRKTPVPEFSGKKLIKTVFIGAIVGGAYGYNPLYTEDAVIMFMQDFGYITVIDRLADLIWARLKGAYNTVKGQ